MKNMRTSPGAAMAGKGALAEARRERRRTAFRANFTAALADEVAGALDPDIQRQLVKAISAAYMRARSHLDARTTIGPGRLGVYMVLRAGLVRARGGRFSRHVSPFAELLLARAPGIGVRLDEPQLIAVGRAIDRAEITRRHPLDYRRTARLLGFRLYVTFIAGRNRRRGEVQVTTERRAPERPTLGLLIFLALIASLATLGAALIALTFYEFADLMMHEPTRAMLANLLHSTLEAARR